MKNTNGPIGLFDSGIGGLSVLAAVQRRLPYEDILYLADQANIPYGSRSVAELRSLTTAGVTWLLSQGAKIVVVACNSASAAALDTLRQTFPDTPFVGMVPAVKPAAQLTDTGIIGVLATEATITGELLHAVVERYATDVQVLFQPCPGLAAAVEQHEPDAEVTRALITRYVVPLIDAGADILVLGCTHYPLLARQIQAIAGSHVKLVDPAPAIAEQVARLLIGQQLLYSSTLTPTLRFATTGNRAQFAAQIARLYTRQPATDVGDMRIEEVHYAC